MYVCVRVRACARVCVCVSVICKCIFLKRFSNEPDVHFFGTQLCGFKYFYQIQIILFSINHLDINQLYFA